jgi:hypothetical protein
MSGFGSQADEFRAKAAGCFALSKKAPDLEYQRIFYDLAVEWLALAAEAYCREVQQTDLSTSCPALLARADEVMASPSKQREGAHGASNGLPERGTVPNWWRRGVESSRCWSKARRY